MRLNNALGTSNKSSIRIADNRPINARKSDHTRRSQPIQTANAVDPPNQQNRTTATGISSQSSTVPAIAMNKTVTTTAPYPLRSLKAESLVSRPSRFEIIKAGTENKHSIVAATTTIIPTASLKFPGMNSGLMTPISRHTTTKHNPKLSPNTKTPNTNMGTWMGGK